MTRSVFYYEYWTQVQMQLTVKNYVFKKDVALQSVNISTSRGRCRFYSISWDENRFFSYVLTIHVPYGIYISNLECLTFKKVEGWDLRSMIRPLPNLVTLLCYCLSHHNAETVCGNTVDGSKNCSYRRRSPYLDWTLKSMFPIWAHSHSWDETRLAKKFNRLPTNFSVYSQRSIFRFMNLILVSV